MKDLRNLSEQKLAEKTMPKGHRNRFEKRLQSELHQPKKQGFAWLKFAGVAVLVFGLVYALQINEQTQEVEVETVKISSISPEMKRIEDYYVTAINYEISKLEVTPKTKKMLDVYLTKVGDLTKQYEKLNSSINIENINEKTINAMVDNLQLRLQLLLQLKEKLQTLKTHTNEII